MSSLIGDPAVLLWVASAVIGFLGARTFIEYIRRVRYDGPVALWRELLFGSAALTTGIWSSLVLDITAKGMSFEIGYHPLKIFGSLLGVYMVVVVVLGWMTYKWTWFHELSAYALLTLCIGVLQVSVIWSIGAEPGLFWRTEPLAFALLLQFVGVGVGGRMVFGPRRGSTGDRTSRRLLAALVLGACGLAAQELVLAASGIDRQVVSAHARFLPEVAITLVAGAVVPISLVLMLVDQRTQQRARASYRRRRRHAGEPIEESMFAESRFVGVGDSAQQPPKP